MNDLITRFQESGSPFGMQLTITYLNTYVSKYVSTYNCTYYVVVYYTYFHYTVVVTNYNEQKTKFLCSLNDMKE